MSGVNLRRWGSIPEVSERFRGESRGRQCSFHDIKVYGLNYNLPSNANGTSELPSEVNKLNSNLPNETNQTSECEHTEF